MQLALALLLLAQDAEWVQNLRDVNPTVRRSTCGIIAEKGIKSATLPLIELLARETDDTVKAAAVDALERLTGVKGRGADSVKWKDWWEKTGGPSPMEEDMLDFGYDVRPNSRLSCQIKVTEALDGLKVTTPEKQA